MTITAAQKAYALLWRSLTDCGYAQAARRELLASMTEDEQRDAVRWVVENTPEITDAEMIAAEAGLADAMLAAGGHDDG